VPAFFHININIVLLKLLFSNNQPFDLFIDDSPIGTIYQRIYKHLSRAELAFKPWDNPYYLDLVTHNKIVNDLNKFAEQVGVEVDFLKALQKDPDHLNHLHKIYETQYNGNPAWLDFHENIHLSESYQARRMSLIIDYREKAGLLERPTQQEWLGSLTTKLQAGDLYVVWSELGKTPFRYWQSGEPNDIKRLCELSKPWLKLRPRILIALEDIDMMDALRTEPIDQFEAWWANYRSDWETHWNVSDWTLEKMCGVLKFGNTPDYKKIANELLANNYPIKTVYSV
jgi:hypothetical protein